MTNHKTVVSNYSCQSSGTFCTWILTVISTFKHAFTYGSLQFYFPFHIKKIRIQHNDLIKIIIYILIAKLLWLKNRVEGKFFMLEGQENKIELTEFKLEEKVVFSGDHQKYFFRDSSKTLYRFSFHVFNYNDETRRDDNLKLCKSASQFLKFCDIHYGNLRHEVNFPLLLSFRPFAFLVVFIMEIKIWKLSRKKTYWIYCDALQHSFWQH